MSFTVSFSFSRLIQAPIYHGGIPDTGPNAPTSTSIVVRTYPQWFKQISLDWVIPAEWGNCKFHVYSKPGPVAEYDRLTSMAISQPFFTDTTSLESSKYRHSYYIVEALLPNGTSVKSQPSTWMYTHRSRNAKLSSEIQRREYLLLSKFAGVKSYYFKKKYFGVRCHRCWNKLTAKVMDDHCPVCLGTSFEGGYYSPVPVYIQYDSTPNARTLEYYGKAEQNQVTAWTISVPEITIDDIIIATGDWTVYKVVRMTNTQLQTNPVRQMVTLTQLGRGDIENTLMNKDVLDDFGSYLESLGGLYSQQRFPRRDIDSSPDNDHSWAAEQKLGDLPVKYRLDEPVIPATPPAPIKDVPLQGSTVASDFFDPLPPPPTP